MLLGIGGAIGLGGERVARALAQAIDCAGAGPVIALGERLGRSLARVGLEVLVVAPPRRRLLRRPFVPAAATLDELVVPEGGARALLWAGPLPPDPLELIAFLRRAALTVRDGGVLGLASPASMLARRALPSEVLTEALLHAALLDVEQRTVGGSLLTVGRVRTAASAGPLDPMPRVTIEVEGP